MQPKLYPLALALTFLWSGLFATSGIYQTYFVYQADGESPVYLSGGYNTEGAPSFHQRNLGAPTLLNLNGGVLKSYKNSGSNVTQASLYYRIYRQGTTAPSFTQLDLPLFEDLDDCSDGACAQSWEGLDHNINLRAEATDGIGQYYIEIYWTITSSEGLQVDDNFGNYYRAPFQVLTLFLPVELSSFEAATDNGKALLSWTTESETNNDYFQIERSGDGRSWQSIGRVNGEGTSLAPTDYQFVDPSPNSGTNYYRLRQVDFDGSIHFSPIVTLNLPPALSASISVYPNPFVQEIHIAQLPQGQGHWQMQLVNANGQVLHRSLIDGQTPQTSIDVEDMPNGLYVLYLADEQGKVIEKKKLIKR